MLLSPGGFTDLQSTIAEVTTDASDPILPCKNGDVAQRGNTVWYGLRFGGSGQNFHVNLAALGYDSIVAIYTGAPGAFSPVVGGCNDDGATGLASALAGVRLVGQTDYSILVARPAPDPDTATLSFSARSVPLYNVSKTADSADGSCDADCSLRDLTVRDGGGAGLFGFGAGINASSGSTPGNDHLALHAVEVRNNTTQLAGGGVRVNGPTVIIDSIIAGNTAASDGGGLSFGGDANTRVDVANTTVSGNSSTSSFSGGGGGVRSTSNTFIYNSTISANQARNSGGGVLSTTASGRMNLIGVALVDNRADSDGANGGNGGGLRIEGNFALISNTVFAGNRVGSGNSPGDCDKSAGLINVSIDSNHLEAVASSCGFSAGTGDLLGTPALLGALANNGGNTQTHLPLSGSPVVDNGSSIYCLGVDQRGVSRPQDGNGVNGAQCDKGAVELLLSLPDPLFANGFEG